MRLPFVVGASLLAALVTARPSAGAADGVVIDKRQQAPQPLNLVLDPSKPRQGHFRVSAFLETNINEGTTGDSLYAELIRNRAFQEPPTAGAYSANDLSLLQGTLNGWSAVNGSTLNLTTANPLTSALPKSVIVAPGLLTKDRYGIRNNGYLDNLRVTAETHTLSFWARLPTGAGPVKTTMTVGIYNRDSTTTWAEVALPVTLTSKWTKFSTTLTPKRAAPDTRNSFAINVAKSKLPDGFQLQLTSLFPPTYPGTVGRRDLVQALKDLKVQYLRLPGGNDLEGNSIAAHWNWTNTIGPVENRPGRPGTWTGWNPDALGLIELMNLAEAIGATAILGIYAGYSLDMNAVPQNQLQPYVDDALNMLHFLLDTSGKWAQLRASVGRAKPYRLEVVEIGNEDFLFAAPNTWPYRYRAFNDAIAREFPQLLRISASNNNKAELGPYQAIDQHDYPWPQFLVDNFQLIDGWERNSTKIYELEWAALGNCAVAVANYLPLCRFGASTAPLFASIAEAVFGMGFERNGDVMWGAAYAPLLSRTGNSQWTPNLIEFDASNIALSTSYYVQQALSVNPITQIWNSTKLNGSAGGQSNVFHSAGSNGNTVVVKLANYDQASKQVKITSAIPTLRLAGLKVNQWLLASDNMQATNLVSNIGSHVQPNTSQLTVAADGSLTVNLPAWAFTVLTVTRP